LTRGSTRPQAPLAVLTTVGALQAVTILLYVARGKLAAVLLGPAGVGILGVVEPLVQLAAHLACLGLPLAAVKFLSQAHSEGATAFSATYSRLLRTVLGLSLAGTAAALALVLLRPGLVSRELSVHRPLLLLGLLGLPLLPLRDLLTNTLAAARATRASASLALWVAVAATAGAFAGVLTLGGAFGFLTGILFGSAVVLATTLASLRQRLGLTVGAQTEGVAAKLASRRDILTFSLVLWAAYSSYPLTDFVSRHVLLAGFGAAEVGLLRAGLGLSGVLALVLGPSTALYLAPLLNRRIAPYDKQETALQFLPSVGLAVAALSVPLVLFPQGLIRLLLSRAFESVSGALFLFVAAQGLRVLAGVFHALLIGLDDVKVYGILVAAGQLSFGLLSWLWGPTQGVVGVALAFLLSNAVLLLLTAGRLSARHGIVIPGKLIGLLSYVVLGPAALGSCVAFADSQQPLVVAAQLAIALAFVASLIRLAGQAELRRALGIARSAAYLGDTRERA